MANRWPPWIEDRIASNAALVCAFNAWANVPGAAFTSTPKIATRHLIAPVFFVECTAYAAGCQFQGSLSVNGVARVAPLCVWAPLAAGELITLPSVGHVEGAAAGVATTFQLIAQFAGAAGAGFTVHPFGHTGFTLLGMVAEGISF